MGYVGEQTGRNRAYQASKDYATRQRHAIRLWNPATAAYLHMSGEFETADVNYSWSGYGYQAANLRESVEAKGGAWPYQQAPLEEEEANDL